jgi:Kef-type K+ transport system membrane component KefB
MRTRVGSIAIAAAAVGDVTAWSILAALVVFAQPRHTGLPLWGVVAGCVVLAALMLTAGRRLLARFETEFERSGSLSEDHLALILVAPLLCGLATEALGVHVLFGAFIAGAAMPKSHGFTEHLAARVRPLTVVLLLPMFFALNGLRTAIGLGGGTSWWLYAAVIVLVAVAGKMGGAVAAARLSRFSWRESMALGILMNTRGLMELVILNIGLDLGVISQELFSLMVMMAVVTTLMAAPLLHWIYPTRLAHEREAVTAASN